jgi:hypothetical protein
MSPRFWSRLRVTRITPRSKMRQQEFPARKNRKYGTPSDGTCSILPKMAVLIRIGASGWAKSQNLPSVMSS